MIKRRRFKHTTSLSKRLQEFADEAKEKARSLPECIERKQLIAKVEATERALEMEGYLASSELTPPAG